MSIIDTKKEEGESCNSNPLLKYNSEPDVKLIEYEDTDIMILKDVLKRNIEIKTKDKSRCQRLASFNEKISNEYRSNDKKKCSFCSMAFIPFISKSFSCVRCTKFVCCICSFSVEFSDDMQEILCARCCMKIVCDNRSGRWFKLLSMENNRKREAAEKYIYKMLNIIQPEINEETEWKTIDDTLRQLQLEKANEALRKLSDPSTDTSQEDSKSTNSNSITDSLANSDSVDGNQPSTINISINYNKMNSYLLILVNDCKNLPNVDKNPPNSFIKVRIEPFCLKFRPKSKVIWADSNPAYKSFFKIRLSENKLKAGNLVVTIWGKRKLKADKFIGEVVIPLFITFTVANGEFKSYYIKLNESYASEKRSPILEKLRLTSMMKSITKSLQNFYTEMNPSISGDQDFDTFVNEPYMYVMLKCYKSLTSEDEQIEINLVSLYYFDEILQNSEKIKINVILNNSKDLDDCESQCISLDPQIINIDYKIHEKIIFPCTNSNIDMITFKIEISLESGEEKRYSSSDYGHLLKSSRENNESYIEISVKMTEVDIPKIEI